MGYSDKTLCIFPCNSFIFLYLFDIHNFEIIHLYSQAGMRIVNIDFGEYQQQAGYYSSVKDMYYYGTSGRREKEGTITP